MGPGELTMGVSTRVVPDAVRRRPYRSRPRSILVSLESIGRYPNRARGIGHPDTGGAGGGERGWPIRTAPIAESSNVLRR